MNNKQSENRRTFIKQTGVLVGSGILFTILPSFFTSCEKSEENPLSSSDFGTVKISDFPELAKADGAKKITFFGRNEDFPVLIIRKSDIEFITLTAKCTHQGCEVGLPGEYDSPEIECPCHGSIFSKADGSVINPPAPLPLRKFNNSFDAQSNILTIYF